MKLLSYKQESTILAALRVFQEKMEGDAAFVFSMPHFDDVEPLTAEEIDELCGTLGAAGATGTIDIPASKRPLTPEDEQQLEAKLNAYFAEGWAKLEKEWADTKLQQSA